MQLLKDIAQQARFAAMQPGKITEHLREQDADLQAHERAVQAAEDVRFYRRRKAELLAGTATSTGMKASQYEALARKRERRVREIALQSEIILQRRAQVADADRTMLGIMLGVAS